MINWEDEINKAKESKEFWVERLKVLLSEAPYIIKEIFECIIMIYKMERKNK